MANRASYRATAAKAIVALLYAGVGGIFGYSLGIAAFFIGARYIDSPEAAALIFNLAQVGGGLAGGLTMAVAYLRSQRHDG